MNIHRCKKLTAVKAEAGFAAYIAQSAAKPPELK
jgi:hypothetical protein